MFLRADQHVYASVDTAPIALLDLLTKMSAAGHAPIAPIPYEQTDHYNTYKSFMDDHPKRQPPFAP